MKKAYNVYSILGKTVIKAAMLTSVFAVCFLFSSQVVAQNTAPDAILDGTYQTTVRNNFDNLDQQKLVSDEALAIAKAMYFEHQDLLVNQANFTINQEIEWGVRNVLLTVLAENLKKSMAFEQSFTIAQAQMELAYKAYDPTAYTGSSTPKVIAQDVITRFF